MVLGWCLDLCCGMVFSCGFGYGLVLCVVVDLGLLRVVWLCLYGCCLCFVWWVV